MVENTTPYYEPISNAQNVGDHLFWSNFFISNFDIGTRGHRGGTVEALQSKKMLDISDYEITNKRQILRNCVEPELGKHIFDCAFNSNRQPRFFETVQTQVTQDTLFNNE